MRKRYTRDIRSMVLKVGTSVLTRRGRFDRQIIRNLAAEVSGFLKKGVRVTLVSSGAIGAGMVILKERQRPKTMQGLQAAAAVGQRYLMQCYEEAFSKHGFSTAQVLLTWEDLASPKRMMNAKRTLHEILRRGLVPVINENDTVATDEIRFGDNDRLSALLSILLESEALVILSDTDGLFARAQGGKNSARIRVVPKMNKEIFSHATDRQNRFTVGGMAAKLKAVECGVSAGVPVFLADGRMTSVLSRIFKAEDVGTLFLPQVKKGHAGKGWLFHFTNQLNAC